MAHHEEYTPGITHDFGMTPLTWWLAALAGSGMTLMIVAAAIGAITGEGVGVLFALGALMLIGGGVAWFGVARPHEHIDDIDQPLDGGHGHDAHPEPEDDHSPETAHTEDKHAPVHH
jgi:hypothetical protein